MRDERHNRLIRRIRALPGGQLHHVERLLELLESGRPAQHAADGLQEPLRENPGNPRRTKDWPHAPLHRLSRHGTFIVTGGTLHKQHRFQGAERLDLLETALLEVLKEFRWRVEAWAVFSNHYHFVAHAEPGALSVKDVAKTLHGRTAVDLNRLDGAPERAVWHNYWDTELTFQKSYLARLNYVHQNAVKHGLVPVAAQYRWCSAAWFERTATRAQVRTIYSFRTDRVKVRDDYDPI